MQFILGPDGLIPRMIEKGVESGIDTVKDTATDIFLHYVHDFGIWIGINGIPILAEGLVIFSMICFLIGCTGSGKWVEKGVKTVLVAVMLGMVKYAI